MKSILENKIIQAIVGVLLLAVLGFIMTHGLKQSMDIFFLDETGYLVRGTKMFAKIPKKWGPLYCTWYKLLNTFEGNLIDLFYLNFKIMAVLPAMLFFLMLKRYSSSVLLSFLIAACFLISSVNLPVEPKVSFFCISLIFASLWIASFLKKGFNHWLVFLSGALLLSFARPEFYLSFVLILLFGLIYFFVKKSSFQKSYLLPFGIFFVLAIILHLGLGNPLMVKLSGHNRSLIAFGEHFAYNYAQWNHSELYSWLAWEEIIKDQFGDISSVSGAMQSNFTAFWKHIITNTGNFFEKLFTLVKSLIIPFRMGSTLTIVIGILFSLYFVIFLIRNISRIPKEFGYLILMAIPTLISCILVYPRNHYLVLLIPIIGLLFVSTFDFIKEDKRLSLPGMLLLGLLFMIFGPKAVDFKFFEFRKEEHVLNNRKAIDLLENATFEEPIKMLTNEGDFSPFMSKRFEWLEALDKKREPFSDFVKEVDPDVIYITETMMKNPYYFEDESWSYFLINYKELGYQKVPLEKEMKEFFLIKSQLLNKF